MNAEQAYSILGFFENGFLSKSGSISFMYFLENPECYSLSKEDIEKRHKDFFRAFKNMPPNSYVHKQDIFINKEYDAELDFFNNSFISQAQKKHFDKREYLSHYCVLSFSIDGLNTLSKAYASNPLNFKEHLIKEDRETLGLFIDSIENALTLIKSIKDTKIIPLSNRDVRNYIYSFVNAFQEDGGMKDIHRSEVLTMGDIQARMFVLPRLEYLPDEIAVNKEDKSLPKSNSTLYGAQLEELGIHLNCTHVYNQIIYFEGDKKLRQELELQKKLFGQHRLYGDDIKAQYNRLAAYSEEINEEKDIMCRAHFNVIVFGSTREELNRYSEKTKEIFRNNDFSFWQPTFDKLEQVFLGSIVGRECAMPKDNYFLFDLSRALCLFINYTSFKNDDEGIYFNDRIFQIPLRKDIWDAKKKRIPARNAVIVANTGAGKSVSAENIVQQKIELKYKQIVVELGSSFKQLTQLYPDVSLHITYDSNTPLGINPFDLDGVELTSDKLLTLSVFVLQLWRSENITKDTNQKVSLSMIIADYYRNVKTGHSFPDFYNYVTQNIDDLFTRLDIDPDYFNIKSFRHICREFLEGGRYENVCKVLDNPPNLKDKDLIVFELSKIKNDPFLVSLIMNILYDTMENKILSDRTTRGELIFDEYAESQALKDVFSGNDIHSTVASCYQRLRKENGAITTIIQTPAQLPKGEHTDNIIANTQLLYVLPTTEVVYKSVIETFSIQDQSHINLMKSISNDFTAVRGYSELFIRFQEKYATAVRLELSKEKLLAFQTEGTDWSEIQKLYKEYGDMEKAILTYKSRQENENKITIS